MENLIEELTKVNPSNLSEEGLKLFNKINEIIDRNKELEENQLWSEATICDLREKFIPKSKIKEKIEELNKEEQEAQNSISDEEREEYSDANISYILMDIETRRRCYKELLGEEK